MDFNNDLSKISLKSINIFRLPLDFEISIFTFFGYIYQNSKKLYI